MPPLQSCTEHPLIQWALRDLHLVFPLDHHRMLSIHTLQVHQLLPLLLLNIAGLVPSYEMMPPMAIPPPSTEDHPDLYIAEEVKHFLPYFLYQIKTKVNSVSL